MRFKEGDKVQFIENNELIIGTIKRVNNDVGWVDLKVSDLSWFFRKLEDIVKVKEPELIAVPRFAADWIKHCKQREYDLACLLDYEDSDMSAEMYEWLISSADNQELLARAWLDGYEVEKEPLYYVQLIPNSLGYLNVRNDGRRSLRDSVQNDIFKTQFTEGEMREMDERYWQFAVPVRDLEEEDE
ncbi:TPA_asm: DUF1642 domain-containing protein [Listeria monocytogenes]|uniref:DUF1642 domain-containing protein n=1 Tax=Listeria monocytogenes TaxID=1639 RepID=UPI00083CC373|nr:DUF1642 domain-containing protein [Listeria monocytogenes]EAE1699102.1 DUF1642 domain-containing protein [Listeria monocytogenes]EAE1702146.1 DUF1642 domain-containing protein [Listeria monocytogenes]EHO5162936.1 DUF1642 domain-containing protein [Listeria monocytogenes]ODE74860.1 hypothetical protein BB593_00165 [Listeria monocytogenes]ODE75466.1 hypothetical protein BB589_14130 [Listeria monocytogenes]